MIIAILLLLITINYCIIMLALRSGISKLCPAVEDSVGKRMISVIISARNEEDNISNCIESLYKQDYPADRFEVILVDDQSTDRTYKVIQDSLVKYPLNAKILITTGDGGKKNALKMAINEASGEIILTTDADCLVSPGWISLMNSCFEKTNAVFIAGPVMMIEEKGLLSKFQCLEFNSLMAATAGSFGINMPVMSNGANMGFYAAAYQNDMMQDNEASGEDVFTLFSMKRMFGKRKVNFLHSPQATVLTKTQETIGQFIMQRIRWTSKSSSYRDKDVVYTALSVFSINLLLLLSGLLILVSDQLPLVIYPTAAAFTLKCAVDYLLLRRYSGIYGQANLLKFLLLLEPIVILYTSLTGIIGNMVSFKWKGRRYN